MVKLRSHDEINRLSNGRLVISREVSLFVKSGATDVARICATCRWIGNQADGFLWLHTGQCVRNQGPRQSAHDFHHTMEILRRTMFDTAFPPGFTRSLTNKLIWWHSKEIKWVQKPFLADHFFWHLDSELMSKMIVMLRSEKVTVWEWREWQMVLNQYSHSLARPHSKGLRRCAAPQNTQPASLSGKLKHLFFLWWESCGRRGHFWKVWLRLESCANFEWLMFWCKLYFFRPTLNTQPASWAIWWCSHRSPTLSALSSLLIVLLVVRLVWIGKTRRSFALKSFGSIIAWHSPCMMKKATGKAVK